MKIFILVSVPLVAVTLGLGAAEAPKSSIVFVQVEKPADLKLVNDMVIPTLKRQIEMLRCE